MTTSRPTCHRCAEVIGVYEPMVAVVDGQAYETSSAAEPALGPELGELYHRACYHEQFRNAPGHDQGSQPGGS